MKPRPFQERSKETNYFLEGFFFCCFSRVFKVVGFIQKGKSGKMSGKVEGTARRRRAKQARSDCTKSKLQAFTL